MLVCEKGVSLGKPHFDAEWNLPLVLIWLSERQWNTIIQSARCRPGNGQTWALSARNLRCWHAQQNHPELHIRVRSWNVLDIGNIYIYMDICWIFFEYQMVIYSNIIFILNILMYVVGCMLFAQLRDAFNAFWPCSWSFNLPSKPGRGIVEHCTSWAFHRSSFERTTCQQQSWCIVHWFNFG